MRITGRKKTFRNLSVALAFVWLVSFFAMAAALADEARVRPASSGEGWFWESRPTTDAPGDDPVGDVFNYPIPGRGPGSSQVFAPDHLYVAWDGVNKKAEMYAGISFDLSSLPPGSQITRFMLTLTWHPNGGGHSSSQTPNYADVATQGLIACSWPDFIAGAAASSGSSAPGNRDCNKKVDGTVTMPSGPAVSTTVVDWTFDLTPLATKWADGESPGISIQPKPIDTNSASWQTSFHTSAYSEINAAGEFEPKPGVVASVTWTPPSGSGGGGSGDDFFTEVGGDLSSFGDSGGLVEQLAPPVEEPTDNTGGGRVLAAGVEGSAPFWKIPMLTKLVAIIGFILIAGSGLMVQAEPAGARPAGAASALMRGKSDTS